MKKALLFIVIVIVIGLAVYGIVRNNSKTETENENTNTAITNVNSNNAAVSFSDIKSTPNSDIILYVGDGCPHCTKVEEFIKTNKIDEKIAFEVKEVWKNTTNADDLNKTAEICKIPKNDLGVPLLLDKKASKCYVGQDEISSFLKTSAGIN